MNVVPVTPVWWISATMRQFRIQFLYGDRECVAAEHVTPENPQAESRNRWSLLHVQLIHVVNNLGQRWSRHVLANTSGNNQIDVTASGQLEKTLDTRRFFWFFKYSSRTLVSSVMEGLFIQEAAEPNVRLDTIILFACFAHSAFNGLPVGHWRP
jgi:hypothetical protein